MKTVEYPLIETLNEASAARVLGISRLTLQRARKRGDISHYRVGSRVLYAPNQIADYLASVERKRQHVNELKDETTNFDLKH